MAKSSGKRNKKKAEQGRQRQASRAMISRLTRPPKSRDPIPPLARRAVKAWEQRDYEQALDLFEKTHRGHPENVSVLLDLARAHLLRYHGERARELFAQAEKMRSNDPHVLSSIAAAYVQVPRLLVAKDYYLRAISLPGCPAKAFVGLAEIHERLHAVEDGCEMIERALELEPEHAEALRLKARLTRRAGDLARAEALLRDELAGPARSHEARWQNWYELAGLLDRQGRYDEAMQALGRAKQRLRREARQHHPSSVRLLEDNRRTRETLTPEHLQRWDAASRDLAPLRPLALLCGHPRSGTTLLEQVLDSHPRLISADETVIMGHDVSARLREEFGEDPSTPDLLDGLRIEDIQKYRSSYLTLIEGFLGEPLGDRTLLDKNPSLTFQLPVIHRIFPDMKILFALRDPRDVCLSCFMQPLPMNNISCNYLTLEDLVNHYATAMNTWLELRPSLRCGWLEVRYEDMVADLEAQARRCLAFLDLPWDDRVLQFHEHARKKHVRSPTYEDVIKPVHAGAIGRWRNYASHFEPFQEKLAPFVEAFGYA